MFPPRYVRFKEGFEKELLEEYGLARPQTQIVMEDMGLFCHQAGFVLIITDIISNEAEDKRLGRISLSHSEGRAFDFRIHDWTQAFLDKFEKWFENKYARWAAVSKETGQRQLIVYHDNGNGKHGHCQLHKGIS